MKDLIATKGDGRRRANFISTIKEFLPNTGKFKVNLEFLFRYERIVKRSAFQHFQP